MGEIAMRRMVVVSNRVSLPEKKTEQAGGLATAVAPLLQAEGGLWFGWSGKVHEEAEDQPLGLTQAGRVRYATFDLSPAEFEGYYNNYANGVLWPLLHGMPEIMKFARADLALFEAVNARFADLLEPVLAPDDLIWVHDYHLFLLPRELRERGVENPLGFFLHIPFPAPDLFALLPNGADLIEAVLAADLIGFQTEADLLNFAAAAETMLGVRRREPTRLVWSGREVTLGVFPAEIDARAFAERAAAAAASAPVERMRRALAGQNLILGVDRLDPSKGLLQRLAGYRRFLETSPSWGRRVTFLQITPLSREKVASYQALRRELLTAAGQINAELGDPDWTPLRLLTRGESRSTLAGFMRLAQVGLVTPLRDGMNLVAKEFVAAQDPDDPGVLVLSRFAGAARQLDAALLVNPTDPDSIAEAIGRALTMERRERQRRWRVLWDSLVDRTPEEWGRDFLRTLERVTARRTEAEARRAGLQGGLSPLGKGFALPSGALYSRSSNAVN